MLLLLKILLVHRVEFLHLKCKIVIQIDFFAIKMLFLQNATMIKGMFVSLFSLNCSLCILLIVCVCRNVLDVRQVANPCERYKD